MFLYALRRLAYSAVVLFMLTMVVFFISRLSGDAVALMLPAEAGPADMARMREALGLDQPAPVQYVRFLGNALRGDLGLSLWQKQPAFGLVLDRIPATAELAAVAMLIALVVGVPLGILSAVRKDSTTDRFSMLFAVFGTAIPQFWLGLMLILLFAVTLHWLPSSGRGTLAQLILPAITLAVFPLARVARLTRSGLLEVLGQDFIRTARAKGLRESRVIWNHAMQNAAISIVTIIGLQVGTLLGGAVVVETIFAWPGLGRLVVQAVFNRDFPLVQASTLFIGAVFVGVNLLVDLSYVALDPQVRLGK